MSTSGFNIFVLFIQVYNFKDIFFMKRNYFY